MSARTRFAWVAAPITCAVACGGGAPGAPERVGSSASAVTECNSGPYVEGVDVYDGTGTIDFVALKASGVDFAIIKATQGNYDTQKTFSTNWAGARAAGVARSAYHFFDPTVDGAAQAAYFLGVMGTLEPGDLPPMLDLECPDGDSKCLGFTGGSGDEAGSVITSRVNDWLSAVKSATGVAPILYTFGSYFSGAGVDTSGLASFPLDIAYPTTTTCFDVPSPWPSATIWQNSWTAKVGGISGQVDTDRFLGTLAQLQAFEVGGFSPPAQANGNQALSVLSFADGHVEVFAETEKGGAIDVSTKGTGDTWSAATSISGQSNCAIASVSFPPKSGQTASVFVALPDGDTVDLAWKTGALGPFADFGGKDLSRLSALAFQDGHVEVFALGPAGAIWHDAWSLTAKAWSGWQSLGGSMATGVGPILWGDGHAEIFATDASGAAWHNWTPSATSSAWHGWAAIGGGKLATRPLPARWADGHVQIFARGTDDNLYSAESKTGTWPGLTVVNEGTAIAGEPSVVVYPSYGPEVFARDPKGELMHAWTEGTSLVAWASDFNQVLASDPLVWMRPDGEAEVFGIDETGSLVKSLHSGATWSPWSTLATGLSPCTTLPTAPPPARDGGSDASGGADAGSALPPGGDAGTGPVGGASPPGGSGGCGCKITRADRPEDPGLALAVSALAVLTGARRSRRRRVGS